MYEHDPIVSNSIQQLSRERSNQHVRHTFKQSLLTRFPTKESFDAIKETCIQIMRERMDNHSEVWFESKYSILVNELYEESSDILSGSISIELHTEMKTLFERALLSARDEIIELQRKISNIDPSIHLSGTQSGRGRGRGRGRGPAASPSASGRGPSASPSAAGRGHSASPSASGRGPSASPSAAGRGPSASPSAAGRGPAGRGRGRSPASASGTTASGTTASASSTADNATGGKGVPPTPSQPVPRGVADSCMESMNDMGISLDKDQLEEFKQTICGTVNDHHNGDSDYDNMRRALNEAHVMRELRRRHGVTNVAGKKPESTISSLQGYTDVDTIENEDENAVERENTSTLLGASADEGLIDSGLLENITETLEQTHIDEKFTLDCPICLEHLCTDVNSKDYTGCCIGKTCGHALCSSCWKKNRKFKVCPVCRRLLFLGPGRRPDAHVY